ncbi:hypothetical protein D3C80_1834060 [compost metagenome]
MMCWAKVFTSVDWLFCKASLAVSISPMPAADAAMTKSCDLGDASAAQSGAAIRSVAPINDPRRMAMVFMAGSPMLMDVAPGHQAYQVDGA